MDIITSKTETLIQVGDFDSHREDDNAEGTEANELPK